MVSAGPIAVGPRLWTHQSADAGATVDTTGFVSDGGKYGMKVGDLFQHTNTSTNIVTLHRVMTVNSTTKAVDLSDTTTIASGTNTD
jgi:hypothetical protein